MPYFNLANRPFVSAHFFVMDQAVSHGYVRMRNSDITKLYQWVNIGTEIMVEP